MSAAGDYPEHPRMGVGALVIRDGRVLLIKRGNPPGEGTWTVPGGRVQLGESLAEAARREVREETGVTVAIGRPLETLELIERDPDQRVRFHYIIVNFTAEYLAGEAVAGDDALAAAWLAPDDLAGLPLGPGTRTLLAKVFPEYLP
jgi:8-oxo-dGTP diphosphatase